MRRLLFACLLWGSAHAFAFDRLQVEGYTLPNGLQLLLKPGTERGHVAIRLVVGLGLDDFRCEEKELPHLLEHLLFSGIDGGGEGDLEDRMQALGGEWNAYTSNADTTFVIEAPAQNQRKVLDLLLAIVTRTELTDANINAAKQVVEREDGGHYSHLQRLLDRQDLGHTASNQLAVELGLKCAERAQVDHLTRDQLESLRKHWYAPNNMTLIIVGDLDKLLPAYLERTYGQLDPVEPSRASICRYRKSNMPPPATVISSTAGSVTAPSCTGCSRNRYSTTNMMKPTTCSRTTWTGRSTVNCASSTVCPTAHGASVKCSAALVS